MGWAIGWDSNWNRHIGYGVPAICDHPGCNEEIDRGLAFVCGGEPYGEPRGCGGFFCGEHLWNSAKLPQLCARCKRRYYHPFKKKKEHPKWVKHILWHFSWNEWRIENPGHVKTLREKGEYSQP